ncbi:hypothetical protein NXS19_004737 [Fusarium pseudograminearum]|nr:hypothetical protein NXS19_004737 [Fusarium pseudograminearum]
MSAAHHIRKCRNPVHVYIDDSNIYIGGQKLYDSRDYDISKLRNLITRKIGRLNRAALLNFYGAHLDPNLQLDDLYEKDEIHSIFYCPRNGKGEEKQADTQLTADMTRCVSRFHSIKAPCVFVVVSGDGDMVPAVREAADRGLRVHVWAWQHSLSPWFGDLQRQAAYGGLVTIHLLDEYLYDLLW